MKERELEVEYRRRQQDLEHQGFEARQKLLETMERLQLQVPARKKEKKEEKKEKKGGKEEKETKKGKNEERKKG